MDHAGVPEVEVDSEQGLDPLLEYLHRSRGFDFSGYKRAGLVRRLRKRMAQVGIEDFEVYRDHLEIHPEEFTQLFNTFLINVTGFFRDPEAWGTLVETVLPRILDGKRGHEPIRVWSAGCSSGEEAYTLVMVLAEAMGWERFKAQVKIYATDVDDEALQQARAATYTAQDLESVPEELRERYFDVSADRFVFKSELRRCVVFGRNDLSRDAPISHLDLLVCRNVLMYFHAEARTHILARFHFGLEDAGFLFLGRAEMLLTRSSLFRPVVMKARIFSKVSRPGTQERVLVLAQGRTREEESRGEDGAARDPLSRIHDLALDAAPVAQLVVDAEGTVVLASAQARSLFGISGRDVGRALRDLEVSYRPLELRSRVERALAERRPVYVNDVKHAPAGGSTHTLDVQLTPLLDGPAPPLGVSIVFNDVTPAQHAEVELRRTNEELETAYEELQATNEEMETTNEELQSTIEELETTNEELHSTNEELETMNEELHSMNEELETMNDELRRRTDELGRVSGQMDAILSSMHAGVAVLDPELRVKVWNDQATELWGLRVGEVSEQPFLGLDIGLPVGRLAAALRRVLTHRGGQAELLDATNRRGRTFPCRVMMRPLHDRAGGVGGVVIFMEEAGPPGETPPPQQ